MPISSQHIAVVGKSSLEYYLRNPPVDQIQVGRPWIKKLRAMKERFGGGKENVVVQLRKDYDESGEWYFGAQEFIYHSIDSLAQAFFAWRSFRDGFTMTEDEFIRNGLTISEDGNVEMTGDELVRLTDIFREKNTALLLGFEKQLDQAFNRAGTSGGEEVKGRDHLVPTDSRTGTVGSINAANESWWRSRFVPASTGAPKATSQSTMVADMEKLYRSCQETGGMPDYIDAGSEWVDAFRAAAKSSGELNRYITIPMSGGQPQLDPGTGVSVDGGVQTGLHFKGVPILWNPVFKQLDALDSPTIKWEKRGYFINCNDLKLMPIKKYDEVAYNPPGLYNTEARYFQRRWKGALIMRRRNGCGVSYIS